MKSVPVGIAGLTLVASGLLGFTSLARAQEEDEPQPIVSRALAATVDYGNDAIFQPAKHSTDFELLGLQPGKIVNMTVQFPVELAGQAMLAEAMDGGALILPEGGLVVAADGTVAFQFQAGESQGACRIAVHQTDDSNFIQLWVVDPDHPENTPPDLPGAY
jgi:hypothetical protein